MVAGRSDLRADRIYGEVVGSGVANVDGPLGDRHLPKATQRFYRESSHSAKAQSVLPRGIFGLVVPARVRVIVGVSSIKVSPI